MKDPLGHSDMETVEIFQIRQPAASGTRRGAIPSTSRRVPLLIATLRLRTDVSRSKRPPATMWEQTFFVGHSAAQPRLI